MMPQSYAKLTSDGSPGAGVYPLDLHEEDATECDICRVRMTHVNYSGLQRPANLPPYGHTMPMTLLVCDRCLANLRNNRGPGIDSQGYGGQD